MPVACTTELHEKTKVSALVFVFVNDYHGLQVESGRIIVLANCPRCHSTLYYPMKEWER